MIKIEATKCTACGGCINLCPDAAMTLGKKNNIVIDKKLCSECCICIKACPVKALSTS